MANNELQPDDVGATPASPSASKARRALSGLKRELTDEELSSPGAQKMLLEELERLGEENGILESFRDKFYASDRQLAVLIEKQKRNVSMEIISGSCLAVGAAALGYAPAVWDTQPNGGITLVFGALLTIAGIWAKAIKL